MYLDNHDSESCRVKPLILKNNKQPVIKVKFLKLNPPSFGFISSSRSELLLILVLVPSCALLYFGIDLTNFDKESKGRIGVEQVQFESALYKK